MLQNYYKAFKAYDIRGIYGSEIDKKFSCTLWKAIWAYMIKRYTKDARLLIWCDARDANIEIINHFLYGMKTSGFENFFFAKFTNQQVDEKEYPYGICSTSMLYYLGQGVFDLGVSITASHNTGEYVGMKFFDKNVELISTDDLKEMFQRYYSEWPYDQELTNEHVELPYDIKSRYQERFDMLQQKWASLTKKHNFVVDFSNGAGLTVEKDFFEILKSRHSIFYLNDFPDGNFSAHESDTSHTENYTQVGEKVRSLRSDFGIMFDWDADRIWFVSASGEVIGCDIITAIIAKQVLKQQGTGKILLDVMSSKVIEEIAQESGWEGVRFKTGRFFINRELNRIWAIMAGEASGHYMFGEIGWYEMPLLALYYVLMELETHDDFDKMVSSFQRYYKSPVKSIQVADKQKSLALVQEKYLACRQEFLDGISVYGDGFWFNVRASNTENKLRFSVEADTKEEMESVLDELTHIVSM